MDVRGEDHLNATIDSLKMALAKERQIRTRLEQENLGFHKERAYGKKFVNDTYLGRCKEEEIENLRTENINLKGRIENRTAEYKELTQKYYKVLEERDHYRDLLQSAGCDTSFHNSYVHVKLDNPYNNTSPDNRQSTGSGLVDRTRTGPAPSGSRAKVHPPPEWRQDCPHRKCKRYVCKYTHEDQKVIHRELIPRLPLNWAERDAALRAEATGDAMEE
ncbi:hypothetical protein OPT61_g4336 [Boeremia exigua]|uniref:Uncharacterized protein n=1 Tax=Boeremia exigua TaxID=749465 RepID=A0ACC2IEJ4_9PLEO|nr:hypothetical protein OPT61_g4336 [Boeremia exigua]